MIADRSRLLEYLRGTTTWSMSEQPCRSWSISNATVPCSIRPWAAITVDDVLAAVDDVSAVVTPVGSGTARGGYHVPSRTAEVHP